MPINPKVGETAARGKLSGTISGGVTWSEDIAITEDGSAISGSPGSWTWYLTLRKDEDDTSALLTLSTTAGTLAISQGTDSTVLQIRVARSALTAYRGDYICDISSVDTSDTSPDSAGEAVHWAHGVITIRNEPVIP